MTTYGRQDSFLAGATNAIHKRDEHLDEVVLKALQVANIRVYCTKNKSHVMKLVDISKAEICPMCWKSEGVRSDVYVTEPIPAPTFSKAAYEDEDDDESKRKQMDPTGMLTSGTGLPRKPVTGGKKKDADSEEPFYGSPSVNAPKPRPAGMSKSEMVETGGLMDGKPIVTKRGGNPRRGTWTGTR